MGKGNKAWLTQAKLVDEINGVQNGRGTQFPIFKVSSKGRKQNGRREKTFGKRGRDVREKRSGTSKAGKGDFLHGPLGGFVSDGPRKQNPIKVIAKVAERADGNTEKNRRKEKAVERYKKKGAGE